MSIKMERRSVGVEELRAELNLLERQHSMSSEEFAKLYEAGELPETSEMREWSILYSAWETAVNSHAG